MLKDLPKHSTLLIVSDTPMWQTSEGAKVFEPTLREVEWLADVFDRVTWIGYGHLNAPKSFSRLTVKTNIDFIVLPYAAGGNSQIQKLRIVPFIPRMVKIIYMQIRKHQFIHSRGPAVPALIAILFSYINRSANYWHKYAGNWKQDPAPWAYSLQRFLLRHNPHKVSVNGTWENEPQNVISIENPCLTNEELQEANKLAKRKSTSGLINLCFVGALVSAKGIHQVMDSLPLVKHQKKIGHVYIAGDGIERMALEHKAALLSIPISFLGNIKRDAINKVYQEAHIIILPSATEGFPKVIAEAAAFGCVPIVTRVSSIGQYIKDHKNGLLLKEAKAESVAQAIDILLSDDQKRVAMANELITLSSLFTYERYCSRVLTEIF